MLNDNNSPRPPRNKQEGTQVKIREILPLANSNSPSVTMNYLALPRPILPAWAVTTLQPRRGGTALLPRGRNPAPANPQPTALQPRATALPIHASRPLVQPRLNLASLPRPSSRPTSSTRQPGRSPLGSASAAPPRPPAPAVQRSSAVSVSSPRRGPHFSLARVGSRWPARTTDQVS